ncbi:hypothetical protein PEC301899_14350 [Pectobacterium carotovorum subsp. carotovorum]|nr:hypothetical protein PEC301899_14350 [Pectobacterium carotovorum subsp. carotovorum]
MASSAINTKYFRPDSLTDREVKGCIDSNNAESFCLSIMVKEDAKVHLNDK